VDIRYNVVRVYPLFGGQIRKRSKILDLKNAVAVQIWRVNGLNTCR